MNSDVTFGLVLAGVGTAGYFLADQLPEDSQKLARVSGGLLGVVGLIVAAKGVFTLGEGLAESGGIVAAVGDSIIGTPGPSDKVKTKYYQASKEPKAKNLQRLSGALIRPGEGASVSRNHFFGSAYKIMFDVSNWGVEEREVDVKFVVHEQNLFGTESPIFDLGRYKLPPKGGSVIVEAEAAVESLNLLGLKLTGRLYGNNYLLDRNDFFIS